MLGKLAKYLRFLGYDALFTKEDDDLLIGRALRENRILLTRDTGIVKRRAVKSGRIKSYYVQSDDVLEQIKEVVREFHLSKKEIPYCTICNVRLIKREKEEIKDKVPPYVYKTQKVFGECPSCHRIYWRGTHWKNFFHSLLEEIDSQEAMIPPKDKISYQEIKKGKKKSNNTSPS
jgi:hypothetical protein